MSFLLNRLLEENYWVVWWIYILTFQEIDKWFFREEMLECSRSSHPRQHLYFLSFWLQLFKRVIYSGISLCWVAFSRGSLMLSIFSSACQLLIDCLCTNVYLNLLLIFIWIIYLFDIKSSLYMLDSSSLWNTWFAKFFSSSVTSLFISIKTFFFEAQSLHGDEVQLPMFLFLWVVPLVSYQRTFCQPQFTKIFSSCVFFRYL